MSIVTRLDSDYRTLAIAILRQFHWIGWLAESYMSAWKAPYASATQMDDESQLFGVHAAL